MKATVETVGLSGNSPQKNSKQQGESGPGMGNIKPTARPYKGGKVTPTPSDSGHFKEGGQS